MMLFGYGFVFGTLFAWWIRFAVDMYEKTHLIRRLSRWRAWPGWRDSIITSEHRT